MAVKQSAQDKFAQIAAIGVPQSAANTLTFARLDVIAGAQLGKQKYGMVLHKCETYVPPSAFADFTADTDFIQWGLSIGDNIAALSLYDPAVLHFRSVTSGLVATAAGTARQFVETVYVDDFSSLPGGGIIISADRLYGFVDSGGLANAHTLTLRLYYTMMELSTEDYWELVESRRIITA